MKRIILIFALLGVAVGSRAQADTTMSDSLWWADQQRLSLELGLSAGANIYSNAAEATPYYSKYGFFVQVPLLFNYRVSPHWGIGGGLRYDFCYDPLHYAVRRNTASIPTNSFQTNGLDFESASIVGRQNASIKHHYIGIPLQAAWYPYPRSPRLFRVTFDIFAGYAFATLVNWSYHFARRTPNGGVTWGNSPDDDGLSSDDPTLLPWRLEVGVSLASDMLGLLHGVRFFANLLPSYRDPITGENIHNIGMSLYL